MINTENWQYCYYFKDSLKAIIHLGADLDEQMSYKEIWYLNVLNKKNDAEFQMDFENLNHALEMINSRYQNWTFVDSTIEKDEKSGGSCSSCVAH